MIERKLNGRRPSGRGVWIPGYYLKVRPVPVVQACGAAGAPSPHPRRPISILRPRGSREINELLHFHWWPTKRPIHHSRKALTAQSCFAFFSHQRARIPNPDRLPLVDTRTGLAKEFHICRPNFAPFRAFRSGRPFCDGMSFGADTETGPTFRGGRFYGGLHSVARSSPRSLLASMGATASVP